MSVAIWLDKQFEWAKLFFAEDKAPCAPSHKNLMGIVVVLSFVIAFLKKSLNAEYIPEIPAGWQLVILGILGIRAAQSAAETIVKSKNGNGAEIKKEETK